LGYGVVSARAIGHAVAAARCTRIGTEFWPPRIFVFRDWQRERDSTYDLRVMSVMDSVLGYAARYDSVHLFGNGLYVQCCGMIPRAAGWISKRLAK
jgi:hypothetical protein